MRITWTITNGDRQRIGELLRQQADHPLVKEREEKNLTDHRSKITKRRFWKDMVHKILTSNQRSDEGSPVSIFVNTKPFPLEYAVIREHNDRPALIARTLSKTPGIRFHRRIAGYLEHNFELLESGEWQKALREWNRLVRKSPAETERGGRSGLPAPI